MTDQREEELKPCPFCGATPLLELYKHDPHSGHDRLSPTDDISEAIVFEAICENPKCEAGPNIVREPSMQSLVKLWNTRPLEDELLKENEELRKDYKSLMFQVSMLRARLPNEVVQSVIAQWEKAR